MTKRGIDNSKSQPEAQFFNRSRNSDKLLCDISSSSKVTNINKMIINKHIQITRTTFNMEMYAATNRGSVKVQKLDKSF